MRKLVNLCVMVAAGLVAAGCSTPPPGPSAPLQLAPKVVMKSVPDWYLNPPDTEAGYVFAVGTAISRDLSMSGSKALLDAETKLAYTAGSELSSMTKDYKVDAGDDFSQSTEIVTNKIAKNIKLGGAQKVKVVTFAEGGGYRTYIMLRFNLAAYRMTGSKAAAEKELATRTVQ